MEQKTNYPDNEILENLQQVFEETLSVYAFCYGRPYVSLLSPRAEGSILELAEQAVSKEERQLLVASFSDHPIENIIIGESALSYAKNCAVAIRDNRGRCIAVWIFVAFCSDLMKDGEQTLLPEGIRRTTEKDFEDSMPMVERMGSMYFSLHDREVSLNSEVEELTGVRKALDRERRRNEVLGEILELLESDQDFSKVIDNILHIAGEYVGASDANLLRMHQSTGRVDMICEWKANKDDQDLMMRFINLEPRQLPFFNDRPYTISSGASLPREFADFFAKYDITAGIFLPLEINGRVSMYVCFLMIKKPRQWAVEELHFFNSIKRVMQSILNRRMTKNSLAGSYAALDAILDNNGCGICVAVPGEKDYLYSNELFGEMLSDAKDAQDFANLIADVKEETAEVKEYFAESAKRWFHIQMATINWVDGRRVRLSTLFEITESKLYLERMKRASYTDYLTGLYNRQRFESDFAMLIKDAIRADESGSFLYLNLDDFKDINGGPGLRVGDSLLKDAAKALLAICRSKATCYRIGGDEFGMLVAYSEQEHAKHLVETIQHRFEQPWRIGEEEYHCTMSLGVVSFPHDGTEVDELMQRAQLALSIAKKNGRGQAEYYSLADEEGNAKRLEMENAMRDAVNDGCGEFEVYYQPLMDASDPKHGCIGAEALVRWNSKALGFVKPDEFIPMAEYLGLIVPIGWHVLHQACRSCKQWNDFGNPDFTISVNLSVVQLMQSDVVSVIRSIVEETGINPKRLILEITESVAIHDMQKIKAVLQEIRDMGISIALDDFGTGYSSLSRLKELPLDEIKIDKSFVDGLTEDEFSDAFVETVTNLADTISVNVVVEGVEQEKQARELDNMKVDMFQGYLFDKPLTEEEFERKYMLK
ncbi:MAG: bifunctional diguanylate cyclase/phosphodiesterase [Lachnospiraceae bacterium]|nr:bifunctional diguanylate cyclase/phosphodiesterase [Lachnospiraceae bacterium]